MPTDKQISASRRNGSKSRGPVTPEGKRHSSRNAFRHGLLARSVAYSTETTEVLLELINELADEYHPATRFEQTLVEAMAVAIWREQRAWCLETHAVDARIAAKRLDTQRPIVTPANDCGETITTAAFLSLAGQSREIDLLIRYRVTASRDYLRAERRLRELQDRRGHRPDDSDGPVYVSPDVAPPEDTAAAVDSAPTPEQYESTVTGMTCAPRTTRPLTPLAPTPERAMAASATEAAILSRHTSLALAPPRTPAASRPPFPPPHSHNGQTNPATP